MNDRKRVLLADGRTGKIMRIDTLFPSNDTKVTIWTSADGKPGLAKVELREVLGEAPKAG
ncbi:MAG TPA: hypothetical protein VGM29_12005 [Polyangiaceae bacterium]